MTPLIMTVFVTSLLGSLHCAGMCGGVVALCLGTSDESAAHQSRWLLQASYNAGRVVTYASLGVIAGSFGSIIEEGSALVGMQRGAALFAGAMMIAFGIVALLRLSGVGIQHRPLPRWIQQPMQRLYNAAFGLKPMRRSFIIGILTGLLPCGWLWAFVIAAAGTASPVLGGMTMIVFWTGTLPVMLALGTGLHALTGRLRKHLPTATAVLLVLVGAATILMRIQAPAMAHSPAASHDAETPDSNSSVQHTIQSINAIDHSQLPCCTHDDVLSNN